MGSPKALLEYRGETFLDCLIGRFSRRCSPVIAVLGAQRDAVRAGLRRANEALLVVNPDYLLGQLSSMQCGLRAIPPETEGVLFTLVDHPAVMPATIDALLDASPALLRIPRSNGRRGHPIWFAQSMIAEFLSLPPTAAARDVVARHAAEIGYVEVNDPGILEDVDDPSAYASLLARSGA